MRICSKEYLKNLEEAAFRRGWEAHYRKIQPIIEQLRANCDAELAILAGSAVKGRLPILDLPAYPDKKDGRLRQRRPSNQQIT